MRTWLRQRRARLHGVADQGGSPSSSADDSVDDALRR
jgi:hypothetical protein